MLYYNTGFVNELKTFLLKTDSPPQNYIINKIKIYYNFRLTLSYKIDKKILKNIVNNNSYCTDENVKLEHIIWYRSKLTYKLVMTNNYEQKNAFNSTNMCLVYQFIFPNEHCKLRKINYIGNTTTTLSSRLTMHLTTPSMRLTM